MRIYLGCAATSCAKRTHKLRPIRAACRTAHTWIPTERQEDTEHPKPSTSHTAAWISAMTDWKPLRRGHKRKGEKTFCDISGSSGLGGWGLFLFGALPLMTQDCPLQFTSPDSGALRLSRSVMFFLTYQIVPACWNLNFTARCKAVIYTVLPAVCSGWTC